MSPNAAELFATQLGEKASTRNYLMYIGYPIGGLLIALSLFLMLKACGCVLPKKEEYDGRRVKYGAINDDAEDDGK